MVREKKECILVAAAKAFSRFGFKKASIDEIAKDAGVAKGTVYLACDSKEDLFYQALHREVRHWLGEVSKVIDPRMPADELLFVAAQTGFEYLQNNPMVRDLLVGATQLATETWGDKIEELQALGRSNIIEILNIGIRQKRIRPDFDVPELAQILQDMMIVTHLHVARKGGNREGLATRMRNAYELIMNGIRVPA